MINETLHLNCNTLRGQLDALQGKPRHYGCHVGMRSTLERSRSEYFEGFDEVHFYLVNGDVRGRV